MPLDKLQTEILHALVKDDAVKIHQLLDLPLTVCLDQCRVFRGCNENFKDQILLRPDMADSLNLESARIERAIIKSLIAASQVHGMTEKESQNFLATGEMPIQSPVL